MKKYFILQPLKVHIYIIPLKVHSHIASESTLTQSITLESIDLLLQC